MMHRASLVPALGLALLSLGACQSSPRPATTHNPSLSPIIFPAGASTHDADRAKLARFVGVWAFEGWSVRADGQQVASAGHAAGTIEDEHFIALDLQAASGQLSGRAGRKSGTMLMASEPGIGLTLSAWGDASPSISRLVGQTDANGGTFWFNEARTPAGRSRVSITVTFETDDRWIARIRDTTAHGDPVVAMYTFTRQAN